MLISHNAGPWIALVSTIIVFLLLYLFFTTLLQAKFFNKKSLIWAGFLASLCFIVFIAVDKLQLTIVNEYDNRFFHNEFYVIGNVNIQLSNSKTYNSTSLKESYYERESQKLRTIVLNNTDSTLGLMELQYLYEGYERDHESWKGVVNPKSQFLFSRDIYYYFDYKSPPLEIEDDDKDPEYRFWLFRVSDLDNLKFIHKDTLQEK